MTDQEFQLKWNSAPSLADVASAASATKGACANRACKLRKSGWQLKRFPSNTQKSLSSRFWKKVERTSSCWNWTGATNRKGYGQISQGIRGLRPLAAHRVSWELHHKRKIPAGMIVMHTCDNPSCVNPRHLRVGTHKDNSQDMVAKQRARGQKNQPRHDWYVSEAARL